MVLSLAKAFHDGLLAPRHEGIHHEPPDHSYGQDGVLQVYEIVQQDLEEPCQGCLQAYVQRPDQ